MDFIVTKLWNIPQYNSICIYFDEGVCIGVFGLPTLIVFFYEFAKNQSGKDANAKRKNTKNEELEKNWQCIALSAFCCPWGIGALQRSLSKKIR